MLNNMVASFTASNQVGEAMKNASKNKKANKKNSTDENFGIEDSEEDN